MATHLIQHRNSEAALLDTNGFFSPVRMRDLVVSRLTCDLNESYEQNGYVYRKASSELLARDEHLREMATEVLSRIKVMRVVDLTGIIESIHEVGAACEKSRASCATNSLSVPRKELQEMESEIPNSQDDEEEALLDEQDAESDNQTLIAPARPIEMLVIDKIANHAGAELSNNRFDGRDLLTTCMRSLRSITKQHNLCTIVINDIVGTKPYNGQRSAYALPEQVSIFTSVLGKPALGKTFAHLVDTSLLISKIPARKEDARLAMNEEKNRQKVAWKSVLVLEVLYDRHGSREGQWSAFDVVNGLDLVSSFA